MITKEQVGLMIESLENLLLSSEQVELLSHLRKLKQVKQEHEIDLSPGDTVYCIVDNEKGIVITDVVNDKVSVAWSNGTNSEIEIGWVSKASQENKSSN